ncbi:hypothetical protein DBB29_21385 [Pandoraea cepalis]|uniref:Uncharacterized protein n=1 Tax=Pandoraea cepalis TaxID=2508294 RepID=A0AAW7MSN1_9BURK|nr:hypothetical protein [Pandoraea cepalis]MDN4580660.1 hypothetical protein [Pandoraea cepalis]
MTLGHEQMYQRWLPHLFVAVQRQTIIGRCAGGGGEPLRLLPVPHTRRRYARHLLTDPAGH